MDPCSNKIKFFNKLTRNYLNENNISTIGNYLKTLNIKINSQDKGEIIVKISLQDKAGQ